MVVPVPVVIVLTEDHEACLQNDRSNVLELTVRRDWWVGLARASSGGGECSAMFNRRVGFEPQPQETWRQSLGCLTLSTA